MPDTPAPEDFQRMLDDVVATHVGVGDEVDQADITHRTWAAVGVAMTAAAQEQAWAAAAADPTKDPRLIERAARAAAEANKLLVAELAELARVHGRPGVAHALTLLCRAPARPLRIRQDDVTQQVTLGVDVRGIPVVSGTPAVVAKTNYWAGLVLTAGLLTDGLALSNVLSDITDDAMLPVLEKVSRYVAGVVEAMADVSGRAWAASDERRRQREQAELDGGGTE